MITKEKLDKWLDTLNYWFEHVEEFGERYPDMKPMLDEFDETIDEVYNETKHAFSDDDKAVLDKFLCALYSYNQDAVKDIASALDQDGDKVLELLQKLKGQLK